MKGLFSSCSHFTSIYFSNFNTNNVENMEGMFYGCTELTHKCFQNSN